MKKTHKKLYSYPSKFEKNNVGANFGPKMAGQLKMILIVYLHTNQNMKTLMILGGAVLPGIEVRKS